MILLKGTRMRPKPMIALALLAALTMNMARADVKNAWVGVNGAT